MEKDFIGLEDFRGTNIEKSFAKDVSVQDIEKAIDQNFEKGLIDEDTFLKAQDALDKLNKCDDKMYKCGDTKIIKGVKYEKTEKGWQVCKAEKKEEKEDKK